MTAGKTEISLYFYTTKIRISGEEVFYYNISSAGIVWLEYLHSFPYYDIRYRKHSDLK